MSIDRETLERIAAELDTPDDLHSERHALAVALAGGIARPGTHRHPFGLAR